MGVAIAIDPLQRWCILCCWVVVSNIFYFHPYLGKWSNLTNIFSNRLKPPTRLFPKEKTTLLSDIFLWLEFWWHSDILKLVWCVSLFFNIKCRKMCRNLWRQSHNHICRWRALTRSHAKVIYSRLILYKCNLTLETLSLLYNSHFSFRFPWKGRSANFLGYSLCNPHFTSRGVSLESWSCRSSVGAS